MESLVDMGTYVVGCKSSLQLLISLSTSLPFLYKTGIKHSVTNIYLATILTNKCEQCTHVVIQDCTGYQQTINIYVRAATLLKTGQNYVFGTPQR